MAPGATLDIVFNVSNVFSAWRDSLSVALAPGPDQTPPRVEVPLSLPAANGTEIFLPGRLILDGSPLAAVAAFLAIVASAHGASPMPDWSRLPTLLPWLIPVALLVILPAGFAAIYGPTILNPGVVGLLFIPLFKIVGWLGLLDSIWALVLVYPTLSVPFCTWIMIGYFASIPKELEESAMIDGCTRFQALRRVIFPLTLPGMGATLGFVFTAAWSELLFALMLINSEEKMTFAVGLLTFVSKFSVDWGQMMAAGVLALIPACIFFAFIQRYLVQGLTAGALKG